MSVALAAGLTVEELLALPEDFHTVHRPGARPEMFNDEETLSGGMAMPGLEIAVAQLFG